MFQMKLGFLPVFLWASVVRADTLTYHIHSVTGILEDLEFHLKGSPDLLMKELFQELECCKTEFCQLFFGSVTSPPSNFSYLSEEQSTFLKLLVNHQVNESLVEQGVVLTPDGTTVSLSPLLAGIAAGLKRHSEANRLSTTLIAVQPNASSEEEPYGNLDPLFAPTLAMDLGISFLLFHDKQKSVPLGPNGCWDSISEPRKFTLMGPASLMPDAFINGAMDGIILGTYLAGKADPLPNVSAVLNDYYGGKGLENGSHILSNFRRKNFAVLVSEEKLKEQVERSLHVLWRLNESKALFEGIMDEKLMFLANQAAEEFMALYVECPAVIPRCMWGAQPYRGTPTQLKLPLGFVYIHHTHSPAKQCRTFSECSANMRSMQRFHQDVRGWDDIGYSFVAGSDGYLYQGRGWHWVGAHTKGFNSKGYGVAFIGDYMESLPAAFAMELVKNNFMKCAVRGLKLKDNYIIHGHRQMGNTLCPGDRLFEEIKTWHGFKMRCFMDEGVYKCI